MAQAFVAALPHMKRMGEKFQPPFMATVSPLGAVHVFCTHDQLLAAIAARRWPSGGAEPRSAR
jgi:hypothetical protein